MTSNKADIVAMIEALKTFQVAHREISKLWDKGVDLNELESVEQYPFHVSFDDLDIADWVQESIDELIHRLAEL